jgi:hypothetical protein
MSDFQRFGQQLREVLLGLLVADEQRFLGEGRFATSSIQVSGFPSTGEDEIHPQTTMTVNLFGKGQETIVFPAEAVTLRIARSNPFVAVSGLASIETEMVDLHMTGESELLGPITLRGGTRRGDRKITGRIIESSPGRRFPADNFFDVLLEIETRQGVFFNKKPEHMVAVIEDIPPNFAKTPYRSTTEINLYSRASPDGPPIGAIVKVEHASA